MPFATPPFADSAATPRPADGPGAARRAGLRLEPGVDGLAADDGRRDRSGGDGDGSSFDGIVSHADDNGKDGEAGGQPGIAFSAGTRSADDLQDAVAPAVAGHTLSGIGVGGGVGVDPEPDLDIHPEPDETLMLRYAAGDIAAFDTLYSRHELRVWRYLLRSVGQADVADDLLQDVWFSVARQGGGLNAATGAGYQPAARFTTWLFTIAHHRLVDHFRARKAHVSLDADVGGGADGDGDGDAPRLIDTLAADSGFGPLRQLQSREQAAALIAAVEALPAEQRDAFLLQAEAGLPVDDIARATGVSFETAKSRLRYARNSLRRQLQEFA